VIVLGLDGLDPRIAEPLIDAGALPNLVRLRASGGFGRVARGLIEDNTKRWGGDHIIAPTLVPGVLFTDCPFRTERARLLDFAPTILSVLGPGKTPVMEGESLL
jgi:hypothetical protein